jgi:hypothetical protein
MLVSRPGGGTFTLEELRDDLAAAGFTDAALLRRGEGMDSVVRATTPDQDSARESPRRHVADFS